MVDQAAAWDGFAACMARPHTRAMMGSTGSGGARPDGGRAPLEVRFALDSPLEGDGFEPSVPHKKQPFLATPVRSPQFAFHNKNRLFRARNRWFESISLQRRVCELEGWGGDNLNRALAANQRQERGTLRTHPIRRPREDIFLPKQNALSP